MAHRIQLQPLPPVAALYTRVSTREQAENGKTSPKTQEAGCRAWALANGYQIDPALSFSDQHSGEELWERAELTRLREAAKQRQFAVVVAHSIDRLSRDPVHLGIVLDELERQGIAVQFVTEQLDDTPDAALIRTIKAYAGKIENERRKERTMRSVRARALGGKWIPSNRPTYGYAYGPEVDQHGKLTKVRLVIEPETAAVVRRIFEQIVAGISLRTLAAALTADGIPTPSGRSATWNPITVRKIIGLSTYWGQPMALRQQSVPVERALRPFYAKSMRRVDRPESEWIPFPEGVAPAIVSGELAEAAQTRLAANRELAARNNSANPIPALLRGGIARCGYCGGALYVNHLNARKRKDGPGWHPERWMYKCKNATRIKGACSPHAVDSYRLDAAVWAKLCETLRDPDLIRKELADMQATEAPGADTLALIDERIAGITRRLANLRRLAEQVDDAEQTAQFAEDMAALIAQQRAIEKERAAAIVHYSDWHEQQAGLQHVLDLCERVGRNLDSFSYDERRSVLVALKAEVKLYRAEHTPRATLALSLPLAGELPLMPMLGEASGTVLTPAPAPWGMRGARSRDSAVVYPDRARRRSRSRRMPTLA